MQRKLKYNSILFLIFFILQTNMFFSQSLTERYSHLGQLFVPQFSSAPFPDSGRTNGHSYADKIFSFQDHYNDSSVAIFIPNGFKQTDSTNMVVYFHGWNNNIDSACSQFNLIEQFSKSNINAIFVFPEGPKNSPDSYGGKLEKKDGLKNLINDVSNFLINHKKLNSPKIGNIILAGHSGAYRVISYCIMRGGLTQNISDVILFDALYGQTEKFSHWIENNNGRFIDIYTDSGGTKNESESLMQDLDAWGSSYFKTEEKELIPEDLKDNRLIFIHSDLSHNEVISKRNQLLLFLKTSKLPKLK